MAIVLLEELALSHVYYNDKIWPACIPQTEMDLYTGMMSLASGWGSTQPLDYDQSTYYRESVIFDSLIGSVVYINLFTASQI